MRKHETALQKISMAIAAEPASEHGVQLRQFLWSLSGNAHVLNLYCLFSRLSPLQRLCVNSVLAAAAHRELSREDLDRALLVSGERERHRREELSDEWIAQLGDVEHEVERLLRVTPPGYYQRQTAQVLLLLRAAHECTRNEIQGEDSCPF
jgi:hypothetical protein